MKKAKLPGLPNVSTGNPALDKWVRGVAEYIEVREGNRGDASEQVLTKGDLKSLDTSGLLKRSQLSDELRKTRAFAELAERVTRPSTAGDTSIVARFAAEFGVSEQKLQNELSTHIQLISGPDTTVGTVNYRIAQEALIRASADAAEIVARVEAVTIESIARTAQVQETAYAALEATLAANNISAAVQADVALARTELTSDLQAGLSAEAALRTILAAKLDTDIGTTLAVIADEADARADGDSAEASARSTLSTQLLGADGTGLTAGLIYTERTTRSTEDLALAQQITLLSAGAGEQFDWQTIWYFDSGIESWTGNGTPTASAGWLRPANQASGAYVESPAGCAADAAKYGQVRLRVRKTGAPTWAGYLYWQSTLDATWDNSRRIALTEPTWDVNGIGLVTVSPTWSGTINKIRVDASSAQTVSAYYEWDWVAIGRPSPGASSAQLLAEQTARAAEDSAITTSVTTLSAQVNNATTGLPAAHALIVTEQNARVASDVAEAAQRTALAAQITSANQNISTTAGALVTEQTVRADADMAISSNLTALSSTVTGPGGVLETQAAFQAEQTTQATLTTALTRDSRTLLAQSKELDEAVLRNVLTGQATRDSLQSTIALAEQELRAEIEDGLSAEAAARLALVAVVDDNAALFTAEQEVRTTQYEATSSSIESLGVTSAGNTAAIVQEQTARATENTATSTFLTSLAAELGVSKASLTSALVTLATTNEALASRTTTLYASLGDNVAAVKTEETARATATGALASSITTVQAGLSAVQTAAVATDDAVDGLSAKYTVKVNAGNAVAGYGLAASENLAGVGTSAFIVQADKFALTTPYTYSQEPTPSAASIGNTWYKPSTEVSYRATSTGTGGWVVFTPKIPFGVDTTTGRVYIDGEVYINAGGNQLGALGLGVDGEDGATGATGATGPTGAAGTRGSVTRYGTGTWSDAAANALLPSAAVIGDTVTISDASSATTKYWGGSAWVDPGVVIDGNLLVTGTLSATKIGAGSITAATVATSGSIRATGTTTPTLSGITGYTATGVFNESRFRTLGVVGVSHGSSAGAGVLGYGGTGDAYGVWAYNPGGTALQVSGQASFTDDVYISGDLTAGSDAGGANRLYGTTTCTNLTVNGTLTGTASNATQLGGVAASEFAKYVSASITPTATPHTLRIQIGSTGTYVNIACSIG